MSVQMVQTIVYPKITRKLHGIKILSNKSQEILGILREHSELKETGVKTNKAICEYS